MKWVQDGPSETETIGRSRAKAIVPDQESAASGKMFGLLAGVRLEDDTRGRQANTERRAPAT